MPDANRSKPNASRPASPPVDPRLALAQQYLQSAQAKLAEEEAAKPRSVRRAAARGGRSPGFSFSVAGSTYLSVVLVTLALTFDAIVLTLCYHMLMVNFIVGRVIALPAGVITFAVWSYISACYLAVIESTSMGHTTIDVQGDWRDWFWTLPSSLGMLAISAAIGWALSLANPASVWWLIAVSAVLTYPVFQLSSLETGSPLAPLSLAVLGSFVKHPIAWFVFYAVSFAIVDVTWHIGGLAWHDPPYSTMLIMGPAVTVALFLYAWLLGQLAHLISTGEKQ